MLDLIPRLREPLSEQGRADFVQATVLSCVVGVVRGVSLVAFIPAAIALTSGNPAWGMSLGSWLVVLARVRPYLLCRRVPARHALLFGGLRLPVEHAPCDRRQGGVPAARVLPRGHGRKDVAPRLARAHGSGRDLRAHVFAPHRRDCHLGDDARRHHRVFAGPRDGVRGRDPGRRRGSVGGTPMPAVGGRPEGASRPRAVPPHRRIRDQAGRAARVWALRLLRAPPAGRRRLRGGRATLTHEGDGWPDRQRHGRPDRRRDAHLRDRVARRSPGAVGPVEAVVSIGLLLRFTQILVDIGTLTSAFETRRPVLDLSHEILSAPELPAPKGVRRADEAPASSGASVPSRTCPSPTRPTTRSCKACPSASTPEP